MGTRLTVNPESWRSYCKELYRSSFLALAARRCCWVLVGTVNSNKQMESLETNKYQVRPAEGGGKIGWDGTRGAGTS